MRDLKRNQTLIYYALYGVSSDTDEWGNSIKTYGTPIPIKIAVSPNKGNAEYESFGSDLSYDRQMSTTKDLPIDEYTRLWIGIEPTKPHNYVVKSVARDINQTIYAIKKVDVNDNNQD